MDEKFISKLKNIIIEAGKISISLRDEGLIVKRKKDSSPVTNADIEISNFIYSELTKLDQVIPIICEEQPLKDVLGKEMIWLVDPIDGTRSYIKNMDSFTVNIALIHNQIPIIGLIYQPTSRKLYFTNPKQEFCLEKNGNILKTLKREDKNYIAVVSSRNFNYKTEKYIQENGFSEIISIPSSIKLCMVAEGSADVYPKFGSTMEWDTAAGHALIRAAGGAVIDNNTGRTLLYNTKNNFKNPDFIAFNEKYNPLLILD